MNKPISINLAGFFLTLEEPAYFQLKQYLDGVKKYFASFPESDEIVKDIETRIAEKLLAKQKEASKLLITVEEVNWVIAEMGNVNDFEDSEAENEIPPYQAQHEQFSKRILTRIPQKGVIAGVAAGFAQYAQTDVAIIRVLLIVCTVFFPGSGLLIYLILWIALPKGLPLPEKTSPQMARKLYRSGEGKTIAGVARGLSAYLNIETSIVRLAFLLLILAGGFGIILYLALWVSMPEAKTISEKVEMGGQNPNVQNISRAMQNPEYNEKPNILQRFISGIARIIEQLFRAFGGIIRFGFGLFALFISAVLLFSFLITTAVVTGIISNFDKIPFPLHNIAGSTSNETLIILGSIAFFLIPCLIGIYLGIRALFRKSLFKPNVLAIMGGVWLISFFVMIFSGVSVASYFSHEGKYIQKRELGAIPTSKQILIKMDNEGQGENAYDEDKEIFNSKKSRNNPNYLQMHYQLIPTDSNIVFAEVAYISRGKDEEDGIFNARMIEYPISLSDTSVTLPSTIIFKEDAVFRAQNVRIKIYVPKNTEIKFGNSAARHCKNIWNTGWKTQDETFYFEGNELKCRVCTDTWYDPDEKNTDDAVNEDSTKIKIKIKST